jgi:hypothetical protein
MIFLESLFDPVNMGTTGYKLSAQGHRTIPPRSLPLIVLEEDFEGKYKFTESNVAIHEGNRNVIKSMRLHGGKLYD